MFIALTNATRVAGAGMSTAAGFPDMRSSLAMFGNFFEQSGMEQHRARWDTRAKHLVQQAPETQATLCHSWLDLLARNGKLLRLFQQNVDGLEAQYPTLHRKTVAVHGSTNPPRGRSSRTEVTRSYDCNALRGFKNDVRSSEIAPSVPRSPPASPPRDYSRPWRGNIEEVLSVRISSISPFTPPTGSSRGYLPEAKVTMSDTSRVRRVRRGFEDIVLCG